MKIIDKDGKVWVDENVNGHHRHVDDSDKPEVDRTALRDLLLDSLEPETVQWGRKVQSIEKVADSTHKIYFADGTFEAGINLLVGADGAFSKVRALVTDVQPFYSGITMTAQWAMDVSKTKPWLDQYVGAGTLFMFDEGRLVISQRQSGDSIRTYAGLRKPLSWSKECGFDWDDPEAVRKAYAEEFFGDCSEDIKRLLTECDSSLGMRHLWMLPVALRWASKPNVTLLGDAAHLMTPFG